MNFENPFTVEPPDGIPLDKFLQLFYDVTPEFPKLIGSQHVFLEGPRGTGKSMMFRYLLPECQCKAFSKDLSEIDFFSILVPIKKSGLITSDISNLESKYGQSIITEYIMAAFVIAQVFSGLKHALELSSAINIPNGALKEYIQANINPVLARCSADLFSFNESSNCSIIISDLERYFGTLYSDAINYVRRQSLRQNVESYDGPLGGFIDFLFPILSGLRSLPFMPKGPIYLLVDDADDLDINQTRILNSWVASRTTKDVCLKISTQQRYKTYGTSTGQRIETPHDFSLISISSIYTSNKNYYQKFIESIVRKRLAWVGISTDPEMFFNSDAAQEAKIKIIADEIRRAYQAGQGSGFRESDDVVRYARPNYMRSLAGRRKSSHSYSYAGLSQLIHISSGVIRHFLEPAARMYAEQMAINTDHPTNPIEMTEISPGIQNKIIRSYSSEFLNQEFEKLIAEAMSSGDTDELLGYEKTRNLIKSLGGLFRIRILSTTHKERKVFSVAVPDQISKESRDLLKRATELGYLHQSTIGNKDGTGRSSLYILHRRLAPEFYLDPTGFAGYLRITESDIQEGSNSPDRFLRRKKTEAGKNSSDDEVEIQGVLF